MDDPGYEDKIQTALKKVRTGEYRSLNTAAKAENVSSSGRNARGP
jgi:hypothetical protein